MEIIAFSLFMSLAMGIVAGMVWRLGRRQDEVEAKLEAVRLILERVHGLLDGPAESGSATSDGER